MFGFVTQRELDRALDYQFRRFITLLRKTELRMSAQSDAFTAALATLGSRLSTLQADMKAQVDAAVAAQKAKDDAASAEDKAAADKSFTDATTALTSMIDSLPAHVEETAQSAAGGDAGASAGTDASAAGTSGTTAGGTAAEETSAGELK